MLSETQPSLAAHVIAVFAMSTLSKSDSAREIATSTSQYSKLREPRGAVIARWVRAAAVDRRRRTRTHHAVVGALVQRATPPRPLRRHPTRQFEPAHYAPQSSRADGLRLRHM